MNDFEAAIMAAEVEIGNLSPAMAGRNDPLQDNMPAEARARMPWMEEEDRFLKENLWRLSEDELAARLGRTATGVHLRWKRDLELPSSISDPDYISASKLAKVLGMSEPRKIITWIRSGMLAGEFVPYRDHEMARVRKDILLAWLLRPESWLYFRPERVGDPNLKRLIDEAARAWGDEWWNTVQAAEFHRVSKNDVARALKLGRIAGMHVKNLSGRHTEGRWAFWFVRKSECVSWDRQEVFRCRKVMKNEGKINNIQG